MKAPAAARSLIAVTSILLLTPSAGAEDAALLQKFDTNANGFIDPDEATPSFLNYFNQIVLPGLGQEPELAPQAEPEAQTQRVEGTVKPVTLLEPLPGSAAVVRVDVEPDVADAVTPEPVPAPGDPGVSKPKYSHAFLLRENASDSSIPDEGASLDNVSGALVSYSSDVRQSTEEWQVKGAILYPVRFDKGNDKEMNGARLTAYTFVPSVAFDRNFDSENVTSELDTLVFEIGSEWEFSGGPWFEKQILRLGPDYATDFSFKSGVVSVTMEYEARNSKWGLGEPAECFYKYFECEWSAILKLGASRNIEAGDKLNIVEDEDYITFGPDIGLSLSPTLKPLDRLRLEASWYYIEDISGDSGAADMLEARLSFGLDEVGHVRLTTRYRHGDLVGTRDKATVVTSGLEITF